MSFMSGLRRLEGLKKLKVVRCMWMLTDILVEAQWMMKACPRLEVVGGLNIEIHGLFADGWLRTNYPRFKSDPMYLV